jgi:hypothetical protein
MILLLMLYSQFIYYRSPSPEGSAGLEGQVQQEVQSPTPEESAGLEGQVQIQQEV